MVTITTASAVPHIKQGRARALRLWQPGNYQVIRLLQELLELVTAKIGHPGDGRLHIDEQPEGLVARAEGERKGRQVVLHADWKSRRRATGNGAKLRGAISRMPTELSLGARRS